MKAMVMTAALVAAMTVSAPVAAQDTAKANLIDKSGKTVGTAQLTETPSGVLIRLELTGVPPGERALHIHEAGRCEPPDFKSAGGHFNPEGAKHGLKSEHGPHAGDMPNLHVGQGGKHVVEVLNMMVTLAKGEPNSLFQERGTALVIHEGRDDYMTDPTGEAGGRLACGVIEQG